MPYEMNDNSGSLFVNDKRESDRHPNAKGSALIDGKEYWVSAWTKVSQSGTRWQSLSFQPKEQQRQPDGGQGSGWHGQAPADDLDGDSIPFITNRGIW